MVREPHTRSLRPGTGLPGSPVLGERPGSNPFPPVLHPFPEPAWRYPFPVLPRPMGRAPVRVPAGCGGASSTSRGSTQSPGDGGLVRWSAPWPPHPATTELKEGNDDR
jgi:hypothetical protein